MSSLEIPHGCIIFQEPGIKIGALQPQMHRFLITGYAKSYPSPVMGPAFCRDDCIWANVTSSQPINTRNTATVRKRNQKKRFVIKKKSSFLLLTCLTVHPDPHDVTWRYIHVLTFLLPQFNSVIGSVGTYLLAQWKRHWTTSRCNGSNSKLENTSHMHNRKRSFQAVRGTVKVTVT